MTLRLPNTTEQAILEGYFTLAALGGGHDLKLFTNDVELGLTEAQINALDETDFTEATFTGYADITVNSGWTYVQGEPTQAVNTPRTFTRSGGVDQTIYGYYLTNVSDGSLAWHDYFPGPVVMDDTGDTITVTPTLTLDDDQEATVTARGVIARQSLDSNSSSYSADATTDFALANVPVDVTRLYKVNLQGLIALGAAGDWIIELYVDGVRTLQIGRVQDLAAVTRHHTLDALWEPATGTPDIDIRVNEISGSSNLQFFAGDSGTLLRQFWVEDVGPR